MSGVGLPSRKISIALDQAASEVGASLSWSLAGKYSKVEALLPSGKKVHMTLSRLTSADPVVVRRVFLRKVKHAGRDQ